jgi:acetylornithine deacetylase/succinyl-diaminopimelate desuccinylase-like protein
MKSFAPAAAGLGLVAALGCSRGKLPVLAEGKDLTRPASEWLDMEPVRLLRDYVRLETTAEKGEEQGALFLKRLLDCEGIATELVCPEARRCNLLARLPGRRREGSLLLLNHIDVVPAFASLWKEAQPFEGTIRQGYLFGRGSYDMKSLGMAELLALREVKRRGIVPETDILFLAEADEETGQKLGAVWLLEHRPEWFAGLANVLNEGGTDEMILRDVRFFGIETLQAGYGFLELEAPSEQALAALGTLDFRVPSEPVVPHPHVLLGFGMLANHLSHPLTEPLRHLDRVRENPAELKTLPDRYGSFLEPRIHWSGSYSFPPGAKGNFREWVAVSVPPGLSPTPYLEAIGREAIRRGVRIVQIQDTGPTQASPYPTAFTETLRRVTEARWPRVPFGPVPTYGGSTTSIHFRNRGIPAYGYTPIPMNITDSARRHGIDERVYLRDYLGGLDLYRDLVEELAFRPGTELSAARGRN